MRSETPDIYYFAPRDELNLLLFFNAERMQCVPYGYDEKT